MIFELFGEIKTILQRIVIDIAEGTLGLHLFTAHRLKL